MYETAYQRSLADRLDERFRRLGYVTESNYHFHDLLAEPPLLRTVRLAAFSHEPKSHDSACISVVSANGRSGPALVNENRALGALLYFEMSEKAVRVWRAGATDASTRMLETLPGRQVLNYVDQHSAHIRASALQKLKVFPGRTPLQLELFDLALPHLVEEAVATKLLSILERAHSDGIEALDRTPTPQDLELLSRLVFTCIAAKVLKDRGQNISLDPEAPDRAFDAVKSIYSEGNERGIGRRLPRDVRIAVASSIWIPISLANVSPTVLSYVYERALVTDEQRKILGTHGTPLSLARYIVGEIPWASYKPEGRRVFEPCCGHSVFLLAAMSSLTAMLAGEHAPSKNGDLHEYLRDRLWGMDIDAFALDVGRLGLLLASWPVSNGWNLEVGDVFARQSPLAAQVQAADVILCNPPFADFEGPTPAGQSVHKPVALLDKMLANAKPNASFGLILPRVFIDGRGYRDVRRKLFDRFADMRIVDLPDNVFKSSNSSVETTVFVGTVARSESTRGPVRWSIVQPQELQGFLSTHRLPHELQGSPEDPQASLRPRPALLSILPQNLATLGDFAEIHRGIEWEQGTPEEKRVSQRPRTGYTKGVMRVAKTIDSAFVGPSRYSYLCVAPGVVKHDPLQHPWAMPKLVVNAARVGRKKWCLAGFADHAGLVVSQRFHAIWPRPPWTARALSGVVNGPVANAYEERPRPPFVHRTAQRSERRLVLTLAIVARTASGSCLATSR